MSTLCFFRKKIYDFVEKNNYFKVKLADSNKLGIFGFDGGILFQKIKIVLRVEQVR
jgi:hypothetical protein